MNERKEGGKMGGGNRKEGRGLGGLRGTEGERMAVWRRDGGLMSEQRYMIPLSRSLVTSWLRLMLLGACSSLHYSSVYSVSQTMNPLGRPLKWTLNEEVSKNGFLWTKNTHSGFTSDLWSNLLKKKFKKFKNRCLKVAKADTAMSAAMLCLAVSFWRHEQSRHVWQKCTLCRESSFSALHWYMLANQRSSNSK